MWQPVQFGPTSCKWDRVVLKEAESLSLLFPQDAIMKNTSPLHPSTFLYLLFSLFFSIFSCMAIGHRKCAATESGDFSHKASQIFHRFSKNSDRKWWSWDCCCKSTYRKKLICWDISVADNKTIFSLFLWIEWLPTFLLSSFTLVFFNEDMFPWHFLYRQRAGLLLLNPESKKNRPSHISTPLMALETGLWV